MASDNSKDSTSNSKDTTSVSKDSSTLDNSKLRRELLGLFSIFFGLLLMLSLATFDSRDPWLNHVANISPVVRNRAGLFGSYMGGMLLDFLGWGSWVVPAFFCLIGARRILGSKLWPWWRWGGIVLLAVNTCFLGAVHDSELINIAHISGHGDISTHGGGLFGNVYYHSLVGFVGEAGAWLIWILCLLLCIQMLVGFLWMAIVANSTKVFWTICSHVTKDFIESRKEKNIAKQVEIKKAETNINIKEPDEKKNQEEKVPQPLKTEASKKDEDLTSKAQTKNEKSFFSCFRQEKSKSSNLDIDDVTMPLLDNDPEPDLPPWVRDFEEGRLGPDKKITNFFLPSEENPGHQKTFLENQTLEQDISKDSKVSSSPKIEEPSSSNTKKSSLVIKKAIQTIIPSLTKTTSTKSISSLRLPFLDLIEPSLQNRRKTNTLLLESKAQTLMTCLKDFGIQGELVGITPGPVVTMFEIRPAPGVRVSRIANLSDDLALALKAVAVRIQAPVPGTDTVGIEIPNEIRETVGLRELFESDIFKKSSSLLTLALGKDIAGNPAIADLATMPHLLVAGATGAGKSVGINGIILSILYKAKPEEVRLLLIDPKRVEMAIYADLPHLVHPVVTDMQLAKNALEWAVREMEQRYSDIARAGVRNINDYNAKLKNLGEDLPEGMQGLKFMPYLVIIIDELADLMLVAAKEVETSIVRLAQLARAAGIHLILATQRPSVDVVTGIIKANFPCRIAFQVTSKHDSRTILDSIGAEHLLGKGDMLFKPGGGKFQRLHGAFVSDKNVLAVADFWRAQQKPSYGVDFADYGVEESVESTSFGDGNDLINDPVYNEAVEFVRQNGKASISLIQRRFRIGFNKAARFIEQMEQEGIIGPQDGSKPRIVLH